MSHLIKKPNICNKPPLLIRRAAAYIMDAGISLFTKTMI